MTKHPVVVNGVVRWRESGVKRPVAAKAPARETLFRYVMGDALRDIRIREGKTLRDVSRDSKVSLGYLSEIERGKKEASSELLADVCKALNVPIYTLLRIIADRLEMQATAEVPDAATHFNATLAGIS
ncbi:MAG: helix-turn-helix transcriptional regulator [Micrococcaceae bacterium]